MPLGLILIVVLIILLVGAAPQWGTHPYGYLPAGTLGTVLVVVLILVLLGRL